MLTVPRTCRIVHSPPVPRNPWLPFVSPLTRMPFSRVFPKPQKKDPTCASPIKGGEGPAMSTRRLEKEFTLLSPTSIAAFTSPRQRARYPERHGFQAAGASRTRLVERNSAYPEDRAGEFRAERPDRQPFRDGTPSRAGRVSWCARAIGESSRAFPLQGRRFKPCPVS
jgi:hypothetical protein